MEEAEQTVLDKVGDIVRRVQSLPPERLLKCNVMHHERLDLFRERILAAWIQFNRTTKHALHTGRVLPLWCQAALVIRNTAVPYRDCSYVDVVHIVDSVPYLHVEGPTTNPFSMLPYPTTPTLPDAYRLYGEIINTILPKYSRDDWFCNPPMYKSGYDTLVAGGAARAYLDGTWPHGTHDLDIWVVRSTRESVGMRRDVRREYFMFPGGLFVDSSTYDRFQVMTVAKSLVQEIVDYVKSKASSCELQLINAPRRVFWRIKGDDGINIDVIPVNVMEAVVEHWRHPAAPYGTQKKWVRVARAVMGRFDKPAAKVVYHPLHQAMVTGHRCEATAIACGIENHTKCRARRAWYGMLYPFYDEDLRQDEWCYQEDNDSRLMKDHERCNVKHILSVFHYANPADVAPDLLDMDVAEPDAIDDRDRYILDFD